MKNIYLVMEKYWLNNLEEIGVVAASYDEDYCDTLVKNLITAENDDNLYWVVEAPVMETAVDIDTVASEY